MTILDPRVKAHLEQNKLEKESRVARISGGPVTLLGTAAGSIEFYEASPVGPHDNTSIVHVVYDGNVIATLNTLLQKGDIDFTASDTKIHLVDRGRTSH